TRKTNYAMKNSYRRFSGRKFLSRLRFKNFRRTLIGNLKPERDLKFFKQTLIAIFSSDFDSKNFIAYAIAFENRYRINQTLISDFQPDPIEKFRADFDLKKMVVLTTISYSGSAGP
ncbi:MAG: hypothetical protein Q8R70_00580, partial [Methanoregula sp.]|nr:hypothetical protein [Methanoregula sp.]